MNRPRTGDPRSSALDPEDAAKRRRTMAIIGGILAVVLLVCAIVLTILLARRGRNESNSTAASSADVGEEPAAATTSDDDTPTDGAFVFNKIPIDFEGPQASETGDVNPFLDYRLDCTFSLQGERNITLVVPGFFAADGNAAESEASNGTVWRCWFTPPVSGTWTWRASMATGSKIAVETGAGSKVVAVDGKAGKLVVGDTPASVAAGKDNRGKGFLQYVGKRYMQWSGNKDYFLGGGADSPEGLLNYDGFDATGNGNTRGWKKHERDWNTGDLTWRGGKGKGLVGAINYIADVKRLNSASFLTFSYLGQDGGVFPTIGDPAQEKLRYDVSKMAQWDLIFTYMSEKGLMMHIKLMESQSWGYHDAGKLGVERKLYYREIVARFGHHLSIIWNLGEEIANEKEDGLSIPYPDARKFADYIRSVDAYRHPIVLHTWPTNEVKNPYYQAALDDGADSPIEGFSIQGHAHINRYFDEIKRWVDRGSKAGAIKVVSSDEQGPYESGILSDKRDPSHFGNRTGPLWQTYLAGGAAHASYFGFYFPQSDVNIDDLRSRDVWWDQVVNAVDYFKVNKVPFTEMTSSETLTSNGQYAFFKAGSEYHVQLVSHKTTQLDLRNDNSAYSVAWYDPVSGGALQSGSVACLSGGGWTGLGSPPGGEWKGKDWIVRLKADKACASEGNPDVKSDCKGAFIRVDTAGDDCCLRADVEFTLVTTSGENPPGTQFSAESGACACTAVSGLSETSRNEATGVVSYLTTSGPLRLACQKPWEASGRACTPTLVSLESKSCEI